MILDAGLGDSTLSWRHVQPAVSKFTRVCSYDRAGMGFSDGAPVPRDANAIVSDLHTLLQRADVKPPYVLVGHSIAGMYEPLFAGRYRSEVAGMVLVDPSFPYQERTLYAAIPALRHLDEQSRKDMAACYRAAMNGTIREKPLCGFPPPKSLESQCAKHGRPWCEIVHAQLDTYARPAFWKDLASEDAAEGTTDSAENAGAARGYGAMPLIVLTAAKDTAEPPFSRAQMEAVERPWMAGHDAIARRSSVGVNFLVHGTQHYIQNDRPSVVISAISEVLAQSRY